MPRSSSTRWEWRVFAACRKAADCERMSSEFGLETCLIDYQKPETIASGYEAVLQKTGGTLDALFNNGAYGVGGAAEDTRRRRCVKSSSVTSFSDGTISLAAPSRPCARRATTGVSSSAAPSSGTSSSLHITASATKFALRRTARAALKPADTEIKVSLNVSRSHDPGKLARAFRRTHQADRRGLRVQDVLRAEVHAPSLRAAQAETRSSSEPDAVTKNAVAFVAGASQRASPETEVSR